MKKTSMIVLLSIAASGTLANAEVFPSAAGTGNTKAPTSVSSIPPRQDIPSVKKNMKNNALAPEGDMNNRAHNLLPESSLDHGSKSNTLVDLNRVNKKSIPAKISNPSLNHKKMKETDIYKPIAEPKEVRKKLDNVGLGDEAIDEIFISFMKQREIEKRKKLEEMARQKKAEQEAKEADLKAKLANKNPYYGMSSDQAENERSKIMNGQAGELPPPMSPEELKRQAEEAERAAMEQAKYAAMQVDLEIFGTSCYKTKCIAFSSLGVLKKGKKIEETGEDVLVVTPTYIKTNLRKIKF